MHDRKVQLDLSFGDPIDATDIEYPSLIDPDAIMLRGYPIELVLAEKIATMMARGEANTRGRRCATALRSTRSQPASRPCATTHQSTVGSAG